MKTICPIVVVCLLLGCSPFTVQDKVDPREKYEMHLVQQLPQGMPVAKAMALMTSNGYTCFLETNVTCEWDGDSTWDSDKKKWSEPVGAYTEIIDQVRCEPTDTAKHPLPRNQQPIIFIKTGVVDRVRVCIYTPYQADEKTNQPFNVAR
jgi:hypothetical protein